MKTVSLICALLVCVLSADASAGGLSAEVPGSLSSEADAAAGQEDAASAEVKAFFHPETGEILTYEEWQALDVTSDKADAASETGANASESENTRTVLEGRKVDLGNGNYVIVVDAPASERIKTKAWFDEEGKAHITCDH